MTTSVPDRLPTAALLSGLAGSLVLTLIHESARRALPDAPRMDTYGRRALARSLEAVGIKPPPRDTAQAIALVGDVAANGLWYSLVGTRPAAANPWLAGAILGAAAGLTSIVLPPKLRLGKSPRGLTVRTKAMTLAWYLAGGLTAGLAYRQLRRPRTT